MSHFRCLECSHRFQICHEMTATFKLFKMLNVVIVHDVQRNLPLTKLNVCDFFLWWGVHKIHLKKTVTVVMVPF